MVTPSVVMSGAVAPKQIPGNVSKQNATAFRIVAAIFSHPRYRRFLRARLPRSGAVLASRNKHLLGRKTPPAIPREHHISGPPPRAPDFAPAAPEQGPAESSAPQLWRKHRTRQYRPKSPPGIVSS